MTGARWTINRVTDAAAEALTTTDAKKHLRVEHSDEDAYIDTLCKGWRRWLEDRTSRSFVKQTWDYFRDEFPDSDADPLELPRGPVISVTSVKYTTTTSTTAQTLAATSYAVDLKTEPGRVYLKDGETWPTDLLRKANGVEVRYAAGFATSATGVPQEVKETLRLLVANSYVNREAVVVGTISKRLEFSAQALIASLDARRYL